MSVLYNASVYRDESGRVTGVFAAARDITLRKRAEEALRQSEAYLAEAQRLSHTGSWAFDAASGKYLYVSEEFFRIFGMDAEAGLPDREAVFRRIHPEDRDSLKGSLEKQLREKVDITSEYRITLPNGTAKHIQAIRRPVLNDAGDVVKFVGTVIDMTERKRAEEERERLRQLEADLAHTNRVSLLGELAASISHELRQPITGAITSARACLRWLDREQPNLERARAAAVRIDNDGVRASEIIDRLRALYKKTPPQREPVDVNEIIGEMAVMMRGEAHRFGVSIRTDLAAGLPQVTADRVQLQQVLMNLMLNALEAMKETGGVLAVKSQRDENGHVLISVSDTGVGLPAEKADQVFNAFFTTKPQGSGMGLAISRSIVESHGGRLWATPNDGRGATFQFTLPLQAEAQG
jgi:PAS domain S-box-containing protein